MWLFTKCGFYSIVKKREDEFHIRARARKDLEALNELASGKHTIYCSRNADYRWRIVVCRNEARRLIGLLADGIDYSNFKGKIADTIDQRDKLPALHEIWGIMRDYQETAELGDDSEHIV